MNQLDELLLTGLQFGSLVEKKYNYLEEKYDLRKIDLKILLYLDVSKDSNTAKCIVDTGLFTKGHVSQSIGRLRQRRMIDTVRDSEDKRCSRLMLMENAKTIISEIKMVDHEIERMITKGISDEELETMRRVAGKIINNINAAI